MSEPVSNAAIEDVLSSIRRLVSEDNRKDSPAVVAPEEDEKRVEVAEKLVLTPSFRVEEPQVEQADTHSSPNQDTDALSEELKLSLSMMQAEEVAETEQAPADEAHVASDEVDAGLATLEGNAPWADPEATLFEAAQVEVLTDPVHVPAPDGMTETEQVAEDEAGADWADAPALPETDEEQPYDAISEEQQDDANTDPPLTETIEALETVVGQSEELWEPDGDDLDAIPSEPMAWQDVEEEDGSDHAAAISEPDVVEVQADETAELEHDVEEPIEPQYADAADDLSEAHVAQHVARDATQDLAADADTYEEDDPFDNLLAEDTFLDEESLRELVTDIVREELQGALGERITRNVRKLVRREIHRALASQDLE